MAGQHIPKLEWQLAFDQTGFANNFLNMNFIISDFFTEYIYISRTIDIHLRWWVQNYCPGRPAPGLDPAAYVGFGAEC
jgi:hypothetical protein